MTNDNFTAAIWKMKTSGPHIQFKDAGGVTALHRAARAGNRHATRRLLQLWPESANCITYASRSPGKWTALMMIADATKQQLCPDADIAGVARLLVQSMDSFMIGQQNSKGNTAFHLAASRPFGLMFLQQVLPMMEEKLLEEGVTTIQEILQLHNDTGKGCMDNAIYNTPMRREFQRYGATCLLAKADDWNTRPKPTHDQLRETKRRIDSEGREHAEYSRAPKRVTLVSSARASTNNWHDDDWPVDNWRDGRWPDDRGNGRPKSRRRNDDSSWQEPMYL
jgi:hypothetical protein